MKLAADTRRPADALRTVAVRRLIAARFLVTFALHFQVVAVSLKVYQHSGRAIDLGFIGLVQFAPMALFSLAAGQLADRFDRRRIMVGCIVIFVLVGLAFARPDPIDVRGLHGLSLLLALGTARAFYGPAATSLLPALVKRSDVSNAILCQSFSWQVAAVCGPAAAGLLCASLGTSDIQFFVVGLLATAAFFTLKIAPASRHQPHAASFRSLLSGVKYVLRNPLLLGALSLDLVAVLMAGATALLPIFATDLLSSGPLGLGLLRAAPAAGGAAVALVLALRPAGVGRRSGAKLLLSVATFGIATIGFGLSNTLWLSLISLAIAGASDMFGAAVRNSIVHLATPPHMRGRVSSVSLVFMGASNELGEFESGLLAQAFGARAAVVVGGLTATLSACFWDRLFPGLRRIDRLEDIQTETEP